VPTYPNFLPGLPLDHAGTDGIDVAADLVAWDTRVLQPRHHALFHQDVAVADAAGMHLDPDLPSGGLRYISFDDFKRCSGLGTCATFIRAMGVPRG